MFDEKELNELRRILRCEIEGTLRKELRLLKEILEEIRNQHRKVVRFIDIKEINMVDLAAGNTATFATTPIPSTVTPDPTKLVWSSSDSVNAPLSSNSAADPSGLSVNVTFPKGVVAGVTFSLTLSYTNSDGTTATQTNSFTTVAPSGGGTGNVVGFTPIVQTV
jgi:hypothetical protein